MLDSLLYVFPVVGGSNFEKVGDNDWKAICHDIYGTAFTIGPNVFMTAGHVLRAAAENEFVGLGEVIEGNLHTRKATNFEIIEAYDIGLIQVPWGRCRGFPWTTFERPMLEAVHSTGYPYAIDRFNNSFGMRAFTGHVASMRDWPQLKPVPRIYELSYPCPRGLSGAPLWTVSSPVKVVGVILGNNITEMDKTTVYQKVEALHLGVALQTGALTGIYSALLGKTIGEHLRGAQLLNEPA